MTVDEMEAVLKMMGCRVSGGVRRSRSESAPKDYWVIDPHITDHYTRHIGYAHSREDAIRNAFYELTGVKQNENSNHTTTES